MIRLHRYPDGSVGLAAFCDTCHEQITERGFIVWNEDEVGISEWRVVHQARCDNRRFKMSMDLEANIFYLANSAGINLQDLA